MIQTSVLAVGYRNISALMNMLMYFHFARKVLISSAKAGQWSMWENKEILVIFDSSETESGWAAQ